MKKQISILIVALFTLITVFSYIPGKAATTSSKLKVHFIDVGQADSILIQDGSVNMLIDAGNNEDEKTIIDYLKKQGVKKLDYVIATHPHEDHIGSMDAVIKTFEIGKIYAPKVSTTTKTFENMLTAIKNKKLKITEPKAGDTFKLSTASCTILGPISSKYEDLNDYSIVLKMTFGNNTFLFMGDAESVSEKEILEKKYDVKADVLKVGHHGSDSSTSTDFLNKVNPKHAVISVGKGNDYGHPTQATMDKLKNKKIPVYRTDENKTIVATSDGKNITFNVKPGSYTTGNTGKAPGNSSNSGSSGGAVTPPAAGSGKTVYITNTGKKYHIDGCKYLKDSKIQIKLEDAKSQGYTPCGVCNPPISYVDPVLYWVFLFA